MALRQLPRRWGSVLRLPPSRGSSTTSCLDFQQARQQTRGCAPGRIFFNSAGSSLPPSSVVDAQVRYLREEELEGGYAVEQRRRSELSAFYPAVARLLNCGEQEVAFAESATRAWTLLMNSIRFAPGDQILTSASDYGSNFVSYIQARERWGAEVVVIPDDQHGQIDLDSLRAAAKSPRARLVAINHVPTCGGLIQPAEEVGTIAKENGLLYLLDACQSVGQLDVNVDKLGCDMLTATGRKFLRGPRGTGFMYVREASFQRLQPYSLDQEGAALLSETDISITPSAICFEHYEQNMSGKLGLTVAIEYALMHGLASIERRARVLSARLRHGLASIDNVEVTDVGRELCSIVTFQVAGQDATSVQRSLAARGVVCGVSRASGGAPLVWFNRRGIAEVVRLSPHYFNTTEEVDECIEIVHQVCSRMH